MVKQDALMESLSSNLHGLISEPNSGRFVRSGQKISAGWIHWDGSNRPSDCLSDGT